MKVCLDSGFSLKIQEEERCKFRDVLENVNIIVFFDIFWVILDKTKGYYGQEFLKGKLLSF